VAANGAGLRFGGFGMSVDAMAGDIAARNGDRRFIHGFSNIETPPDARLMLTGGDGLYVTDDSGRRYLEAMSGMWCASFGFSERALADAAMAQFERLPYYHTLTNKSVDTSSALAASIAEIVPVRDPHVYFALSGSEANDFAVKFLWYVNNARGCPSRKTIIARRNGYHGGTIAATCLTGIEKNHWLFDRPMDRFIHVSDMNYARGAYPGETEPAFAERLAAELEGVIQREGPDTIAGFLAEPVTGGGGIALPPADYYARIQSVLARHGIPFIADEVITGFGRTGRMFACETFGIRPDAMILGKGITGGYLPLAAVVVSGDLMEGLVEGSRRSGWFGHGATYTGYPAGCAVAQRAIDLIRSRNLLAHVREMGDVLRGALRQLESFDVVESTRSVGLLGAVQFRDLPARGKGLDQQGAFAALVQQEAEAAGVIIRPVASGDAVAVCPPFIVRPADIEAITAGISAGIRGALRRLGMTP